MLENLNPVQDPSVTPHAQTGVDLRVTANLAGLTEALLALELDLAAYSVTLPRGGITMADHDLLSSGIRRLEGGAPLAPSRPLEQGYLYAELPSAGYNDLRLRITYIDSKPVDFFVRQMGHPQNGAVEFYSMKVAVDASGRTLFFADAGSQSMQESSGWQLADSIVEDMRGAVSSMADKLNRPDVSQKLR